MYEDTLEEVDVAIAVEVDCSFIMEEEEVDFTLEVVTELYELPLSYPLLELEDP